MSRPQASGPRAIDILHSIVEAYIETGDPVASRTISRARRDNLSPASIRNVMADLCEEGYLSQPHTSAGRIPTEKGFRSYVRSLSTNRVLRAELERVRAELSQMETVEEKVERSSHMLTQMTRTVGIVAAIPASGQTLDRVELLALPERQVLMVVVTRDHIVRNRVITLDEALRQDDLDSIRNYINRNFEGWVLADVREELEQRLEQESAAYDAILKRLTVLYAKGLLDVGLITPEIHMEGASNLVGLDLHLTREKMRELFRTLEEKKRMLALLDQFMEQPEGELGIQVGLADAHPSMGELSLIGVSVSLPNGIAIKLAVLGPMRMNYEKAVSAVLHVGQALQIAAV